MDAVAKNLKRISTKISNLKKKELELIEECLDDCFEQGRIWDSIPTLIDEIRRPPKKTPKKKAPRKKASKKSQQAKRK